MLYAKAKPDKIAVWDLTANVITHGGEGYVVNLLDCI